MEEIKIEKIYLEDGREAERHIKEEAEQTIFEIYAEPPRTNTEKKLSKRIIEKTKPMVYERVIETIEDGKVIDRKVESINPKVDMKLIEHHVCKKAAEKAVEPSAVDPVTHEDLQKAVLSAVKAITKLNSVENDASTKVSAQQLIEEKIQKSKTKSWVSIALVAFIAIQVAACGYLIFWT